MHYKVLDRDKSILIYENPEDINYVSSCQVFICGDKGFVHTLNGTGFYKCFSTREVGEALLKDLGITSLEGYVVKSHAKLMKMTLKDFANVEIGKSGKIGNVDAVWVTISLKEDDGSKL